MHNQVLSFCKYCQLLGGIFYQVGALGSRNGRIHGHVVALTNVSNQSRYLRKLFRDVHMPLQIIYRNENRKVLRILSTWICQGYKMRHL